LNICKDIKNINYFVSLDGGKGVADGTVSRRAVVNRSACDTQKNIQKFHAVVQGKKRY
jgi:hypothetical protein